MRALLLLLLAGSALAAGPAAQIDCPQKVRGKLLVGSTTWSGFLEVDLPAKYEVDAAPIAAVTFPTDWGADTKCELRGDVPVTVATSPFGFSVTLAKKPRGRQLRWFYVCKKP